MTVLEVAPVNVSNDIFRLDQYDTTETSSVVYFGNTSVFMLEFPVKSNF